MSSPSPVLLMRLRAHLGFKLALAVGLNLWAFVPYFWLQRYPLFAVTIVPESALDAWIGFKPGAVWIYLSLFLLMPVAPMQMEERSQLRRYAFAVAWMSIVADLLFFFWPSKAPRPAADAANIAYQTLVTWDTPLNAFPSLHAAMAVFSALCCEQIFSRGKSGSVARVVVWVWVSAIIWAMLAAKQHVALDAAGGIALGALSYKWAFRTQAVRGVELWRKLYRREGWTL